MGHFDPCGSSWRGTETRSRLYADVLAPRKIDFLTVSGISIEFALNSLYDSPAWRMVEFQVQRSAARSAMSENVSAGWFRSVLPFGAVPLVVLSFFSVTLIVQRKAATIDRLARELETNSMPSIHHLTAARAQVHRATIAVRDLVRSREAGAPQSRNIYQEARGELDGNTAAYLRLPNYPAEARLSGLLAIELGAYVRVIENLVRYLAAGDVALASDLIDSELMPASRRVEERQDQIIAVNADEVRRTSQDIKQARQQSTRLSFALHALAALSAGLVLATVARWNRGHERFVESQARLAAARKEFAEHKVAELEMFGSRMAHDIKTPLAAVSLYIALARKRIGDPDQSHAVLQKADDGIQHVAAIIDGLLAFARAAGHVSRDSSADVGNAITNALSGLSAEIDRSGAEIVVEPFTPIRAACSEGMLLCILGNLLGNAIKYIVRSPPSRRRILVRVTAKDKHAHLQIADTGPGIPHVVQRKIYEPYVRGPDVSSPGLGLGLATVNRIVKAHHGELGFRSTVGLGSIFWVELPRAEEFLH
jgi:signal transduction histidine kinase